LIQGHFLSKVVQQEYMVWLVLVLLVQACAGDVSVCLDKPASEICVGINDDFGQQLNEEHVETQKNKCNAEEHCVWLDGLCLDKPASGTTCFSDSKMMCDGLMDMASRRVCVWVNGTCLARPASGTICFTDERESVEEQKKSCQGPATQGGCLWVADGTPTLAHPDATTPAPALTPAPTPEPAPEKVGSSAHVAQVEVATAVTWLISIFGRSSRI